jgi:hypothetical protein
VVDLLAEILIVNQSEWRPMGRQAISQLFKPIFERRSDPGVSKVRYLIARQWSLLSCLRTMLTVRWNALRASHSSPSSGSRDLDRFAVFQVGHGWPLNDWSESIL